MIGRYSSNKYRELFRSQELYRTILGSIFILASFTLQRQIPPEAIIADVLALLAAAILGGPIIMDAGRGLISRKLNVDELVSLAMIASVAIGEYLSAAVVALVMVTGSLLEEFTANKARSAINTLMQLTPGHVTVLREGEEIQLAAEDLHPGDHVIIQPGGKIPADGTVVSGSASINEASLTGESMPVEKNSGDQVYAGTVCYTGMIVFKAEKIGQESTVGKLVQLVQEAESRRAPILRIADRYARYFTPAVLFICLAVYLATADIYRAITVLIVGCPCAFILAAPTAVVAALGNAARNGVLIKGGHILEEMSRINAVIFDKTGTITTGEPEVVGVEVEVTPLDDNSREKVLQLAAAAEKYSEHPLARSIRKAAEQAGYNLDDSTGFRNLPGKGIAATVKGQEIVVSRPDEYPSWFNAVNPQPRSLLAVKSNGVVIGSISIADQIRRETKAAVKDLRQLGLRKIMIMSGDNKSVTSQIAAASGIKDYLAGLIPEEKLAKIRKLQQDGFKVVMVGDGVNDAPSLAAADIGIAMGAMGTEAALEAADIALMGDNLEKLPLLVRLSRYTVQVINLNIFLALAFNFFALVLSGMGILNPISGAITHNIGSVLVVLNSTRLAWVKNTHHTTAGEKNPQQ